MRRGSPSENKSGRLRVFKYGLLAPREPHENIAVEDRKLIALWNSLVELGERSRADWEKALYSDPELAGLARLLVQSKNELSGARERFRNLSKESSVGERDAARILVRKAKEILGEHIQRFRPLKDKVRKGLTARRDELVAERERRIAEIKRDAKAQGVHWSSGEALVDRWRTTWALALQGKAGFPRAKGDDDLPPPYVFRYTQGGCSLSRLFNTRSKVLRLSVPPQLAPPPSLSRSGARRWERRQSRGEAHVRIGDTPYTFGLILHRRPPEQGRVKKAELTRSLRFPAGSSSPKKWHWYLLLTVEEPSRPAPKHPRPGTGAAFAPGWRRLDDRLRAGVLVSREGVSEAVWLPDKIMAREGEARRLQSRLDQEVERSKARVQPWLLERSLNDEVARRFLSQWARIRSGGLLAVSSHMKQEGAPEELLGALRQWDEQRMRLLRIRRGVLRHLRLHRSWWWQNTMLEVCRRFATLVVMDLPLERLQKRKDDEEKLRPLVDARTTAHQQVVGHHEAGRWLRLMAAKTGTTVLELPMGFITKRCSACGRCTRCGSHLDGESLLAHRCGQTEGQPAELGASLDCSFCGVSMDKTENVARNMLPWAGGKDGS